LTTLKKTNNYSTTPRKQTTIRPPEENKQLFDHPEPKHKSPCHVIYISIRKYRIKQGLNYKK
jgi:hypothetical protein